MSLGVVKDWIKRIDGVSCETVQDCLDAFCNRTSYSYDVALSFHYCAKTYLPLISKGFKDSTAYHNKIRDYYSSAWRSPGISLCLVESMCEEQGYITKDNTSRVPELTDRGKMFVELVALENKERHEIRRFADCNLFQQKIDASMFPTLIEHGLLDQKQIDEINKEISKIC